MPEELVGIVTHFYEKIGVAIVSMENRLTLGDYVHFRGRHGEFSQRVESMQLDLINIKSAFPGNSIGIKVNEKLCPGDNVYKIL